MARADRRREHAQRRLVLHRVPKEREPYVQNRIPTWKGPIKDEQTGRWITSHVMNQDFVAWVGQGTIADRTKEHLGGQRQGHRAACGASFFDDLDAIEHGEDPKGIVRDPALNECVPLPIAFKENYVNGMTTAEMVKHPVFSGQLRGYVFQTGQPEEVRRAFVDAMGVELDAGGQIPTANFLARGDEQTARNSQ